MEFDTVVRATHIHVKVFHDHKVATTQLYFPDSLLDQLYAEATIGLVTIGTLGTRTLFR